MSTCYLHIGMHKTGSSSIQETLSRQWDGDEGILYAKLVTGGRVKCNHSSIISTIYSKRKGPNRQNHESIVATYKAALLDFLDKNKGRDVLFSGEGIVKLDYKELSSFHDVLCKNFDEIKILAYVRDPHSYMVSAFQQRAKNSAIGFDSLSTVHPRYQFRFEKFMQIFGVENCIFRKFAAPLLVNNCVVRDFVSMLDAEFDGQNIIRVNEGVNKNALVIMQIYWRYCSEPYAKEVARFISNRLIKLLGEIPGPKLAFDCNAMNNVIDNNVEDLSWMEGVLGETIRKEYTPNEFLISNDHDLVCTDLESLQQLVLAFEKVTGKKTNITIRAEDDILMQAIECIKFISGSFAEVRKKRRNN